MPISEIDAAIDFQDGFVKAHGNKNVHFNVCTLAEAICFCIAPIKSRKMLGLYLHNKKDPFSKKFCASIQSGEIKTILDRSFFLLGWSIDDIMFHKPLTESLSACLGTTSLDSLVTSSCAAFIVVFSIDNEISIFSCLYGAIDNILATIRESEDCFNATNNNKRHLQKLITDGEPTNELVSRTFQQLMSNELGDRDYDRFEPDEHDLLMSKIGFAKFGPPVEENGYNKKQQKIINDTYKQICKFSNKYSQYQDQIVLSIIFICLEPLQKDKLRKATNNSIYNPSSDFYSVPVFVIRKCRNGNKSCRIFVDCDDRVYNSWSDYILNNNHDPCTMIVPKDGRYQHDQTDQVLLEQHLTPSCGIKKKVLNIADIGASITGITSGSVLAAAAIPAVAVAPVALTVAGVAGIGVGVYSIARSGHSLYQRKKYGQSMDFTNSAARGAYINIAAGSLGFVGVGATTALTQLAMRGVNITKGAQLAVNAINVGNLATSGISVGNSAYEVIKCWVIDKQKPSALTIVQLTSSLLFFAHATTNFKLAARLTEEAQIKALTRYNDSLRSNRHRKMFNKLIKATIGQNNGEITKANSEVISACLKLADKDTVFAVLTRNNKIFNKEGIHFFAKDGKIQLNGVPIDLVEFGNVSSIKRSEYLANIPTTSEPLQNYNMKATKSIFNTQNTIEIILVFAKYSKIIIDAPKLSNIICTLLKDFSTVVQEKLFGVLENVLDILLDKFPELDILFEKYFSLKFSEPVELIFRLILDKIKEMANNQESEYLQNRQIAEHSSEFDEDELHKTPKLHSRNLKKVLHWFVIVVNSIYSSQGALKHFIMNIVQYFCNLMVERIYQYTLEQERISNTQYIQRTITKCCGVCEGYYYTC